MHDRARGSSTAVFRNNAALVAWVFMAVWMLMLGCFTYIFVRDGGQPAWSGLVLGLFWLFGLGGCSWAFSQPRVRVEVSPRGVLTREIFPWWAREAGFAAAQVSVPDVIEEKDSDGDPYFKCILKLPGNRNLTVAESGHRPNVDATHARLRAALGKK